MTSPARVNFSPGPDLTARPLRDRRARLEGVVPAASYRPLRGGAATLGLHSDATTAAGAYLDRNEHSPTSARGSGLERTPWHATRWAAWETLKKMSATNYTLGWMLRLALCALMLAGCGPVTYGPEPPPRDGGPQPLRYFS